MVFNVGDRVQYVGDEKDYVYQPCKDAIGKIGTIIAINNDLYDGNRSFTIEFDEFINGHAGRMYSSDKGGKFGYCLFAKPENMLHIGMKWKKLPNGDFQAVGGKGDFLIWKEQRRCYWKCRYRSNDQKTLFHLPVKRSLRDAKKQAENNGCWEVSKQAKEV